MAAKKSETKSDKKSASSSTKGSRKKVAADVAAAPVVPAAVVAAPVVTAPAEPVRAVVDEALVRARAHALFLQHGGSALDNWLRAEREIGASA
jgi:hypothetical protein